MKPGNCCSRGVQKVARTLQDLLTIPTPQIIVTQHYDRHALEPGAVDALTAGVKAVAVDQREHRLCRLCVATPHTCNDSVTATAL